MARAAYPMRAMRFLSESVMWSLDWREKSWQMSLGRQWAVMVVSTSFLPLCKQIYK